MPLSMFLVFRQWGMTPTLSTHPCLFVPVWRICLLYSSIGATIWPANSQHSLSGAWYLHILQILPTKKTKKIAIKEPVRGFTFLKIKFLNQVIIWNIILFSLTIPLTFSCNWFRRQVLNSLLVYSCEETQSNTGDLTRY